jgi:hypothetical protein
MFVSVLSGYCVCFYNSFKHFSGIFASVLDECLKCFICLHMYVASATSAYFKNRSGVASPSPSAASPPLSSVGWTSAASSLSSRC